MVSDRAGGYHGRAELGASSAGGTRNCECVYGVWWLVTILIPPQPSSCEKKLKFKSEWINPLITNHHNEIEADFKMKSMDWFIIIIMLVY